MDCVPDSAPRWCHMENGPLWLARPRWDGFGYEVRQYFVRDGNSTPFVGSRILATTLNCARAMLPRGLAVEPCDGPCGIELYAYDPRDI